MAAVGSGEGGHRGAVSAVVTQHAGVLPNFLIVGAQKAGTTALYYALSKHPQVFMSAVKEPAYFVAEDALRNAAGPGDEASQLVTSLDAYEELFAGSGSADARGESSTSYLYDPDAPQRIKDQLPDVKLIAILRNPVDRAYSNFLHLVRDGREPIHDFRAALAREEQRRGEGWSLSWRYLDKGYYGAQVERYLARFGPDRFRSYLYEDYNDDPDPTIRDIYRFLGVDDDFAQDLSLRLNVGGLPRSRSLQWLARQAVPPPQDPNNTRARRLKWLIDALPDRFRGGLLKAQSSNLSSPPPLSPDLREELLEGYREDAELVQRLTGLDTSRWFAPGPAPPDPIATDEPRHPGI
jgi:hypothetical protein